jgi:hypothetical protein
VILGLVNLSNPISRTSEWITGVVGVLLFIAPWALGFTTVSQLAWSAWVAGVIAVILAGSELFASGGDRPTMAPQH